MTECNSIIFEMLVRNPSLQKVELFHSREEFIFKRKNRHKLRIGSQIDFLKSIYLSLSFLN